MQQDSPVSYCVKNNTSTQTHTYRTKTSDRGMFLPQTEILLPQKVPAMLNANEAVAEVRMWQLRHTTCSKMENKQTNSQ